MKYYPASEFHFCFLYLQYSLYPPVCVFVRADGFYGKAFNQVNIVRDAAAGKNDAPVSEGKVGIDINIQMFLNNHPWHHHCFCLLSLLNLFITIIIMIIKNHLLTIILIINIQLKYHH